MSLPEIDYANNPNINYDSNLVQHARRELEMLGEDSYTINGYLEMITVFAKMGHSGGSASVFIPTLNQLLQFKNLMPLTNDPDEWMQVGSAVTGTFDIWQNRRNAEAFSHNGGQSYYLLSEGGNDKNPRPLHASVARG